MARYLVTGRAGFIGFHVVDPLAARGDVVRVVDDLSTRRGENLLEHPDRPRRSALGERVVRGDAAGDRGIRRGVLR